MGQWDTRPPCYNGSMTRNASTFPPSRGKKHGAPANGARTRAPEPWPSPITRADLETLVPTRATLEALRITPADFGALAFDALPAPTPP
jgi:hypothetical protein